MRSELNTIVGNIAGANRRSIVLALIVATVCGLFFYQFRYEKTDRPCPIPTPCTVVWDRWHQQDCYTFFGKGTACSLKDVRGLFGQDTQALPTADEVFGSAEPTKLTDLSPQYLKIMSGLLSYAPLLTAIIAAFIARKKKRNVWKWGVLTFLFVLLGLFAAMTYPLWLTWHNVLIGSLILLGCLMIFRARIRGYRKITSNEKTKIMLLDIDRNSR